MKDWQNRRIMRIWMNTWEEYTWHTTINLVWYSSTVIKGMCNQEVCYDQSHECEGNKSLSKSESQYIALIFHCLHCRKFSVNIRMHVIIIRYSPIPILKYIFWVRVVCNHNMNHCKMVTKFTFSLILLGICNQKSHKVTTLK